MEYITVERVGFSNIDNNQIIRFGDLVDFLQNSSNYQSEILGIGTDHQMTTNRAWILSSWQIDIYELPKVMDELFVDTFAYSFKGVCGKRNYAIYKSGQEEKMIVAADATWALVDVEKNSLTRITEEDSKLYPVKEKLDMDYVKGKIKVFLEEEYRREKAFEVKKYCIDINNHVNNAWYIKFAEEYVENKEEIKRIRVEYKESAVYNDVIVPYVAEDEERILVELRKEDNKIFAKVEFLRK